LWNDWTREIGTGRECHSGSRDSPQKCAVSRSPRHRSPQSRWTAAHCGPCRCPLVPSGKRTSASENSQATQDTLVAHSQHCGPGCYSQCSVKSIPVVSTVDITGPKNAPRAPRERELWTANTFMVDRLNLFSGRIDSHEKSILELILEEWNAMLLAQISRRSA